LSLEFNLHVRNESQNQILLNIGQVLLNRRKDLNINRSKLALDLGVDEKQIRRIESGQVNFTILSLLKLCVILKIDFSMFEQIVLDEKIIEF
jgi:transcriptional regulator with XRE-family HTH domain